MENNSKIYIVGAGPGDKDLITVKGLKAIQCADAILYDALVNKELLKEAKTNCKLIYVGKRAGKHSFTQDQINKLLVETAHKGGIIVRLKGGDPFIFGRGHEELSYCKNHGFFPEVIPGISSATSLPLLQEVPLTHRGLAQSFWVITGTKSNGEISEDILTASHTSATLVILMGIRKIPLIAETLINAGKRNTPIMVIQNGARKDEKAIIATAENIVEEVAIHNIGTPGIIVIGDVVNLHPSLIKAQLEWRA